MPSAHGKYKGTRFRSLLELSFILLMEQSNSFSEIKAEPYKIPYKIGRGKLRNYIPDFQIGINIYELKHSKRLISRMNDAKFEAARKFCDQNKFIFHILTEKDLGKNLKSLKEIVLSDIHHNIEWSQGTLKKRIFAKKIAKGIKK